MTGQGVEKRKKQTDSSTLSVNWQYVKEPNLSFKRLMTLLLQPKLETDNKEHSEKCSKAEGDFDG